MRTFKNVCETGSDREIDGVAVVPFGETIDVDEPLASGLADQPSVWQEIKAKKPKTEEVS